MKKVIYLSIIMLTVLFCWACGNYDPGSSPSAPETVVKVTVTYQSAQDSLRREYVSSQKMRAVLNYLRWIDPYGKPETDPETTRGGLYRITLHLSDDTESVYLQKADQFMQVDNGPWQTIDPDRAKTLRQILEEMESDGITGSHPALAGPAAIPPHPPVPAGSLPSAP